jgi:hypothetical protein
MNSEHEKLNRHVAEVVHGWVLNHHETKWCVLLEGGIPDSMDTPFVTDFDPYHNDTQAREALEVLGIYTEMSWGDHHQGELPDDWRVCIWVNGEDNECVIYNKSLSAAITEALCQATGYKGGEV